MVYGTVLEHSGDPHFVRFEPEGQLSPRELVAHNFVAWTPLLHRRAGRDISEHCDFQRSLAVGWINSECEVYRSVGVVPFDGVGFLGLSHFFPIVPSTRGRGRSVQAGLSDRPLTSVPGTRVRV